MPKTKQAPLSLPWRSALQVECPRCHAAAGRPCVVTLPDSQFHGKPRITPHASRYRAAGVTP